MRRPLRDSVKWSRLVSSGDARAQGSIVFRVNDVVFFWHGDVQSGLESQCVCMRGPTSVQCSPVKPIKKVTTVCASAC